MTKNNEELIEYLRNGDWIDKLSSEENKILADFLKNSMARQRKKVAFAEKLKDGVIYVIFKVKHNTNDNTLSLIIPGEIVLHPQGDDLPKEISGLPRLAFTTLFCLGELIHDS